MSNEKLTYYLDLPAMKKNIHNLAFSIVRDELTESGAWSNSAKVTFLRAYLLKPHSGHLVIAAQRMLKLYERALHSEKLAEFTVQKAKLLGKKSHELTKEEHVEIGRNFKRMAGHE